MECFLFGLAGGVFAEVLGLFKLRHMEPENFPKYVKSIFYWFITALMVLVGGSLVWIYCKSGIVVSPILAVNIGASAPLILGSLVSNVPTVGNIN